MEIINHQAVVDFVHMCEDGWHKGWHERNGGNLTYRMTEQEVSECKSGFNTDRPWISLGITAANLGGAYFIATSSGKFFRKVALAPKDNICIAEINQAGDSYRMVWGLEKGGKPTSEFPSHLMNHSVRMQATSGKSRVIYHAHTPSLIALTYILPLTDKAFTKVLWQSATECAVVFPGGIGVVPWTVPGGAQIAMLTSEKMKTYDAAVWAHHGLFCSGPDFDITFGLMDTIEKAADIYVRVLSCCGRQGIRQTITDDNLRELAREFGITLNEALL